MLEWFIKPKSLSGTDGSANHDQINFRNINDPTGDKIAQAFECPEHALKIYKSDQAFRYVS